MGSTYQICRVRGSGYPAASTAERTKAGTVGDGASTFRRASLADLNHDMLLALP